jgi:glycosyltransferase involved in cell wall biosynthesis
MEYMALGCAIVAPRQANIEEILVDGESALLFDADDRRSMQASIDRLCRDQELRVRLGSAARALVTSRNLTWDHNAERLERMFEEACA